MVVTQKYHDPIFQRRLVTDSNYIECVSHRLLYRLPRKPGQPAESAKQYIAYGALYIL